MYRARKNILPSLILSLVLLTHAYAEITLPKLISDGMILQRDVKLNIWGWASANEKITTKFNKKTYRTATGADGKWHITMDAMKPGGPYSMEITGKNIVVIHDVFIGDVWFCSGQSNMVLTMERVKEKYPDEVANANYPEIHNFFIPTASDATGPHDDLPPGKWMPLTKENVMGFGAAAYFFAKSIYLKHHVPIGIINASVGGTPAEAWISETGFKDFPKYEAMIRNFKDTSFMNRVKRSQPTVPKQVLEPDKGTSGPRSWYDPDFVPDGWHKFWLPGYWEDQGVKGLNGVLWFRKEINVPASMTGKPAKLFMGRIIDADNVYVNGVLSGSITYQYPPRRYELPAGVLKAGKNIIVVRVTNNSGKGGFVPDKPYYLTAGGENIDLRGEWIYQVGQVFPPREGGTMENIFSAQNSPTGLYNTMVAPAILYAVKGFAWYQGEANSSRAEEYEGLLRSLIGDWRTKWKQGDLPFLFVQLPNFQEVQYSPSESKWAELRNNQRKVLAVPNTAMVTTIELGEWNDIHPLNKKDVGERVALAAEHLAYNDKSIVYSGPLYKSHTINGNKIVITFSNTGSGLVAKGNDALYYFAIAGEDKKYVWAQTKIDGDQVMVWSDHVPEPKSVRYAWANNPEGANLYNKEGLPASPFETDNNK